MSSLSVIANLARLQLDLEAECEALSETLKARQALLRQVSEVDIPEAMREVGLKSFALEDGSKVSVQDTVRAAIPSDRKHEACLWMGENGYGSLVKVEVSTNFKMGEEKTAFKLYQALLKKFPERVVMDSSVHPSTLKSWMMECLANSVKLPDSLFSADYYSKATIKLPKTTERK